MISALEWIEEETESLKKEKEKKKSDPLNPFTVKYIQSVVISFYVNWIF